MTNLLRRNLVLLLAAAAVGCGGHLGDIVGPPPRPQPPVVPPSAAPGAGLLALCAGDGVVRVDYTLPGQGFEAALFLATSPSALFQGPPVEAGLSGTHRVYTSASHPGLVVNGTTLWAGFGTRPTGAANWTPVGASIQCRPGAPLFVDLNGLTNGLADGSTPALAIPLLDEALLVASVLATFEGTKNVWVAAGSYRTRPFNAGIPGTGVFAVGSGVHVYGGFAPGIAGAVSAFDIAERSLPPVDPAPEDSTILRGDATPRILDVISGGAVHIVDGLFVDGESVIVKGVDVSESDVEMRSVRIRDCIDNGLQVKQITDFLNRRDITLVASEVSGSGNDGVGIAGVFDLNLDRSDFSSNGGRGVDPNDLLALSGGSASLRAFGCRFFGNSLDGLGADLNTIVTEPQTPGGVFDVDIDGCTFERNGRDGLFLDQDHDLFPAWRARIRIRDCRAIANRRAGIHLDADDQGEYTIERTLCSANVGDGLWASSEPESALDPNDDERAGCYAVANCAFIGNLGFGIHSTEGDKVVLASHCAFAGNQLGGYESLTTGPRGDNPRRIGSAANCVLWRQPNPFVNVEFEACFVEGADNPFENAPAAFAAAVANNLGALTLAASSGISAGFGVEIGDSGVLLTAQSASGTELVVTPEPAIFFAPDAVFGYPDAATASPTGDLRLYALSAALGTALVEAGTPPRDPGPHGSDNGGEPGVFDPFTPASLRLLRTEPAVADGVLPTQAVEIAFDEAVDPASVTPSRVQAARTPSALVTVTSGRIVVSPPAQGWQQDDVIRLLPGIVGVSGKPLDTAFLAPVRLR